MKIDGKAIAENILGDLTPQVAGVKQKGITPTLAVILIGEDPASLAYIKQKQKAAQTIGAKLVLNHQQLTINNQQLQKIIEHYNNDPSIHGLIVQRPLPDTLGKSIVLHSTILSKDVDGFLPNSPYTVPVAAAVLVVLEEIFHIEQSKKDDVRNMTFDEWLKSQCSAVLGRGETAGKPISKVLQEKGCLIELVHSQTTHPEAVVKKMPIVVSCVGKERVITKDMVTPETILIGVGLWRDTQGKLHGDYEEDEIKDIVAYYTPTPGGVGPVNVACLMKNLVMAAQNTR